MTNTSSAKSSLRDKTVLFVIGGIVLLLLPLVAQYFGNAWVRIIDIALLYVLLALGLNIVVGYAGLLDLGYVAFYAVGAYLFGLYASGHLTETFPGIQAMFPNGLHMPWWIALPLGATVRSVQRRASSPTVVVAATDAKLSR